MKTFDISKLGFSEYKKQLRAAIVEHQPCSSALNEYDNAKDEQELMDVCYWYLGWLFWYEINPGRLPEKISGSLNLSGCTLSEGLVLPKKISGSLDLSGCTLPKDLVLPKEVGGWLDLRSCTLHEGLVLPQQIEGSIYLKSCTLPDGFVIPENLKNKIVR